MNGELRRFLLETHPVRGHHVRMSNAWRDLQARHAYPLPVERLLGEAVTAAVLLAATLKFEGKLSLQLAGNGLVRMLVAQCTHEFAVRATATHGDTVPDDSGFAELVGDGRLMVTIDSERSAASYQGIVPLSGGSVATCLQAYFEQSEQLPTRLLLHSVGSDSAGLLLQKLPTGSEGEAQGAVTQSAWEDLQQALAGADSSDLLLPSETLLPQLCGAHDCRLFGGNAIAFHCGCSRERVGGLLRSLGIDEARAALQQTGLATITCEFCRQAYAFDAIQVEQLFVAPTVVAESQRPS
jgi:molecular chaperone Hsp33